MSFRGKVALVTGGAQGIGKAYSLALLDIGMKVCIVDINEDTALDFLRTISGELSNNVIFHKCNVTSFDDFKGAFDKTLETFGKIDVVVNNAGVFDEHNWKKSIDVNFTGVVHGIKLAYQFMSTDKGGSGGYIVTTASESAFEPSPLCPVYTATKFAVVGLTKSYGSAYHFQKSGIKVCAIAPDVVDTPMYKNIEINSLDDKLFAKVKKSLKTLRPEDLGSALLKILEDGKNGAILRVQIKKTYYV